MKEAKRIFFDKDFDFSSKEKQYCYFNDDRIEFVDYERYVGPITLQYLPNGGVQSMFDGHLIIKVNNGFLCVNKLTYQGKEYTSNEFIKFVGEENLINQVLL